MQKQEVKRHLEKQASMTFEYKVKQGKGQQNFAREHTGHSKHPLPTTQEETIKKLLQLMKELVKLQDTN